MGSTGYAGIGISLSPQPLPPHVAISTLSQETVSPEQTLKNIMELLSVLTALRIPMLTLHFPSKPAENDIDTITTIFTSFMHETFLDNHQIKVSVIGKWYELPEKSIEPIKHVISATSSYDRHFVNVCACYDGQEDIVDAAKMLAKQVQLNKLAPEQVTKATLKEALLTSTLLPPTLIIMPAPQKSINGILLWDSTNAIIHFSDTPWKQFGKEAFLKSLQYFQQPAL